MGKVCSCSGISFSKDIKVGINVRIDDILYWVVNRGVGAELCRGVDDEVNM